MDIIAELCIFVFTWNVGTNHPENLSLPSELSTNGSSLCPRGVPDIYVIGLQEVNTDLSQLFHDIFKPNVWETTIEDMMGERNYHKIKSIKMQGIFIIMFALNVHLPHIRSRHTQDTATGFNGLLGNKGAVSIRASIYGTGVVFVSSHLPAGDGNFDERNTHFHNIRGNHRYPPTNYRNIYDHEVVFWFGDLNYRLTGTDSPLDISNKIEEDRLPELLALDELKIAQQQEFYLKELQEELITFPPTYKFIVGTSHYNLTRRPAWCDRILYRLNHGKLPNMLKLKQLSYRSHPEYTLSDHKPVSAEFLYTIEHHYHSDEELHERTHSATATPLATVTILLIPVYLTWSQFLV